MKALHALVFVAACGGGGSNGDSAVDGSTDNVDAKVFLDAPPNVPTTIALSGVAAERSLSGETAVAGVTMAAFASSNEGAQLASAMTDAAGMYALVVMTNGAPLDGFIKATKSGYLDVYMYPASPFIADSMDAGVNMMTATNRDFLSNLASGNQMAGKGLIGLQIRDAAGNPVAGATVSSSPASMAYRYTGSNGLPSGSATSTSADGVAFMFNVPSGPITISASKAGLTFKSHVVVARADMFTTTSITP